VPSLSFSYPGLREAILSGRKRFTTRPLKNPEKNDNTYQKRRLAEEYQLFWKLRTKETARLMNAKPNHGMVFNPEGSHQRAILGPVFTIRLFEQDTDIPHPSIIPVVFYKEWGQVGPGTPFTSYMMDLWVYREGFDAPEDLYDALRSMYDYNVLRGLWYVTCWKYPPPADQPADAVWTPEMIP